MNNKEIVTILFFLHLTYCIGKYVLNHNSSLLDTIILRQVLYDISHVDKSATSTGLWPRHQVMTGIY